MWIVYCDVECCFLSVNVEDGSVYLMVVLICFDDLMKVCIDILKGYLFCEEGDFVCLVFVK